MTNAKKVSVIMPLFNAERYVYKTINCILNQTYRDFELILIDDCSTDTTMNIVLQIYDSRIKIIHNKVNRGIAFSRNVGLDNATGEFISLMDDDDLAPLDRFEKQICYLNEHKNIDAVGGRYCIIDENDSLCKYAPDTLENPRFIKASLMFMNPLGNGSMMFRTKVVKNNNIRYQDDCLGMEDYLFWVDFAKYGTISNLKDVLLFWRHVTGNETSRVMEQRQKERAEKFFQIQRYAMESYGLSLSDGDFEVLKKMFPESKWTNKVSKEEIIELHSVLKRVMQQAEQKHLDNAEEIKILCRKQFSKRIEFSEIW